MGLVKQSSATHPNEHGQSDWRHGERPSTSSLACCDCEPRFVPDSKTTTNGFDQVSKCTQKIEAVAQEITRTRQERDKQRKVETSSEPLDNDRTPDVQSRGLARTKSQPSRRRLARGRCERATTSGQRDNLRARYQKIKQLIRGHSEKSEQARTIRGGQLSVFGEFSKLCLHSTPDHLLPPDCQQAHDIGSAEPSGESPNGEFALSMPSVTQYVDAISCYDKHSNADESFSLSSTSSLSWPSSGEQFKSISLVRGTRSAANMQQTEASETTRELKAKKTIAAHFQESFYFKRPNWQTDLAESELSSEFGDDDDEDNNDAARVDDAMRYIELRGEADGLASAVDGPHEAEVADRRKKFKELRKSENVLADLSGFGENIAHCNKIDTGQSGPGRNLAKPHRVSIADTAQLFFLNDHSQELLPVAMNDENERRVKADGVCKHRRSSLFAYLPFTSSSGFSYSLGTSTTSSFNFDSEAKSSSALFRPDDKKVRPRLGGCRPRDSLKMDNLKFLIARNLVATLIGAYILVSLLIIISLMLPYLFESQQRANKPIASQFEHQIMTGRQPAVMSRESRGTQTGEAVEREGIKRRIAIQRQQQQQNLVSTHQADGSRDGERLRLGRTKLDRVKLDKIVTGDIKDLWRDAQPGSCEPLTLTFCSRSIQSMMPLSITSSISQMKASDNFQMSYEQTLLPNDFLPARQSQTEHLLERYEPLVDVRCYPLMPLFLCSIFAPKCIETNLTTAQMETFNLETQQTRQHQRQVQQKSGIKFVHSFLDFLFPRAKTQPERTAPIRSNFRLVPPCRSVCKEALRRCTFFLEVLSLPLLDEQDCDQLPESSDQEVCVGHNENRLLQQAVESQKCPDDDFKCNDGECIRKRWRCDGYADCKDKSDEEKCSKCDASNQFYCGYDVCISKRLVCDGRIDCKDGRDERLCLRLASSNNSTTAPLVASVASARQPPRRLEAWNSTTASWVPICGAYWQAVPMSHEACQALGYSRANETLILFGGGGNGNSSTSGATRTLGNISMRARRAHPLLDHFVSYENHPDDELLRFRPPVDLSPANSSGRTENGTGDNVNSLESLLRMGVQVGCELQPAHLSSSVLLSCQNFQCGLSVTSHLSRLDLEVGRKLPSESTSGGSVVENVLAATQSSSSQSDAKKQQLNHGRSGVAFDLKNYKLPEVVEAEQMTEVMDQFQTDEDEDLDSLLQHDELLEANSSSLTTIEQKSPVSSRLVVGGTESMPGEFPYLAALHGGPDEVFFCGGVLISANWLLTAAHCVGNRTQPDGWMVKVGVTRRIASPAFVRKLKVRKIIKHEQFNHGIQLNNDVALILLDELVDFNQYLRPICLPQANLNLGPDNSKDCVVVGFGKSQFSQDANYLHVAHFVSVPIIRKPVCVKWYAEQAVNLSDGMLCAGYSEGKRDACQGDSGSGLFCRRANTNHFFVAGLVSFGVQCAKPKLPGVYSSIPHYIGWINKTTRDNGFPMA